MVPRHDDRLDARVLDAPYRLGDPRPYWVAERKQTLEGKLLGFHLFGEGGGLLRVDLFSRHRHHEFAARRERVNALERMAFVRIAHERAFNENVGGTEKYQFVRARPLDERCGEFVDRIERKRTRYRVRSFDLLVGNPAECRRTHEGDFEYLSAHPPFGYRVLPVLDKHVRIEDGEFQKGVFFHAFGQELGELHLGHRKRSGLVGEDEGRASERLGGHELPYDTLTLCHSLYADGENDRECYGEAFGNGGDGDGDRGDEHIGERVSRVNSDTEHEHRERAEDEPRARAEFFYRRLKGRILVVRPSDEGRYFTELGCSIGAAYERGAKPFGDECARKHHGLLIAEHRIRRRRFCRFFRR